MKKYLKIQNKGLLDIRLFSLMGGTTKENDPTKIGQWGSGLKYAICFLLRNNIAFKIFIGNKEVKITTVIETIANEEFEIIYVDDKQTSLTTKMGGSAWEEWECLREIYSNALDEGEASVNVVSEDVIIGLNDKTCFYIEATPKILEIYNNWGNYFLENKVPMYENEDFKLYPNGDSLRLYKQGVLIGGKPDVKSLFLYDFKHAHINELRQYRGSFENDVSKILYGIDDISTIQYILKNITEDVFEGKEVNFQFWRSSTWDKPNPAWKAAFGNAKIMTEEIKNKCIGKQANVDLTGAIVIPKNLYDGLNHHIEDISVLRLASKVNEFYEIYDADLDLKLKQCITILEEADYFMHPEVKYLFGEFGSGTTLAKIDLDKKEILISQKLKDKSLFNFCTMLVEENEHLRTGMSDETREFQQHFIDLYVKGILDKAEIKI